MRDRPLRVNGGNGSGNLIGSSAVPFLDVAAFASPAAYTYGNTPRTGVFSLAGPSGYDEDISLKRTFNLRESLKLAFQADAIDVFNFVNFGGPNLSITSTGFGKITNQRTHRGCCSFPPGFRSEWQLCLPNSA